MKFKVGDKCKVLDRGCCGVFLGQISQGAINIRITDVSAGYYIYDILDQNGVLLDRCSDCFNDSDLELIPPPPTSFTVNFDI